MQYILTQAEYDELKHRQSPEQRNELQKLCTLAANHVPIEVPWSPSDLRPWGCILSKPSEVRGAHSYLGGYLTHGGRFVGYCDLCPALHVCPHDNKQFRPD